ncbi:hypothetical protein Ddye_006006 [Dipteronia dyeriana]|uniref:Uncharacterized protein n=1 Tax=Dipteronia dyeriana TaxID=168575 RepID=A0AAE0CQS5_9ROSI|nr:hypothetical protein Ddye_006006 [Dipteronia dyeriana]
MANTDNNSSTSTVLAPVKLSSSAFLPPSVRKTQSNKIQNLVEYIHIPESTQIDETYLPLINPYKIFKRNKSLARKINLFIQYRSPPIKEYTQSMELDNCLVSTTSASSMMIYK